MSSLPSHPDTSSSTPNAAESPEDEAQTGTLPEEQPQLPVECGPGHSTFAAVSAILLYISLLFPWAVLASVMLILALCEFLMRKARKEAWEGLPRRNHESLRGHDGNRKVYLTKPTTMFSIISEGRSALQKFVKALTGLDPVDCLIPSMSGPHRELTKEYLKQGRKKISEIEKEIDGCRKLIERVRKQRQGHLNRALQDENSIGEDYMIYTQHSFKLSEHLAALKHDLRKMKSLSETQATFKKTRFHGLADWAEKLKDDHKDLMTAIVQVSFVGAGLTYTTVFSASRGDIGLMSYAWALFNCGFIIPTATLSLLEWASRRDSSTLFASPKIWSFLLKIFVYMSVLAVGAAVVMLNVTIILLNNDWNQDAEMSQPPIPAGAFALVCALLTALVTLWAFGLHYIANGWGKLKDAWFGHPSDKEQGEVQDFDTYVLR